MESKTGLADLKAKVVGLDVGKLSKLSNVVDKIFFKKDCIKLIAYQRQCY